jgi:hypothetical protein
MGTSVNHPSPRTTSWRAAAVGYQYPDVPVQRVVSEVWRAAGTQEYSIPVAIEAEPLFRCHEIVRSSHSASEALGKMSAALLQSKDNSIVVELARRAIPSAFTSDSPTREWRARLFGQLTEYLVSRDVPGYVGASFRNKSVKELGEFKAAIGNEVLGTIRKLPSEPKNASQWRSFVKKAAKHLSGQ